MRVLVAAWFLAHGLAHLPGFLVASQLRSFSELPFHTTILGDSVDVGVVGMRLIGIGWLFAGVAFAALAVAVTFRVPWWPEVAYVVLAFSLTLCVIGWPRSWIGVVSNVAVAALLLACARVGWL
jgi:hypothetical protein